MKSGMTNYKRWVTQGWQKSVFICLLWKIEHVKWTAWSIELWSVLRQEHPGGKVKPRPHSSWQNNAAKQEHHTWLRIVTACETHFFSPGNLMVCVQISLLSAHLGVVGVSYGSRSCWKHTHSIPEKTPSEYQGGWKIEMRILRCVSTTSRQTCVITRASAFSLGCGVSCYWAENCSKENPWLHRWVLRGGCCLWRFLS